MRIVQSHNSQRTKIPQTVYPRDGGEAWSFKGHEECCELTSIIDFSDYYEGVDCDAFEKATTNYVQEYHNDAEDALNIVFQNRKYYDLVKMILAELKEKGITHIKLDE